MTDRPAKFAPDSPTRADGPVESLERFQQLLGRPSRAPDFEKENRALASLMQTLADSPRAILHSLAATLLEVLNCGSAGISLLSPDRSQIHWPAIAGQWSAHAGESAPQILSPLADLFDQQAPLVFGPTERQYAGLLPETPRAVENLLVPFYLDGQLAGSVWVASHHQSRVFNAEDLRLITSLSRFAAAACRTVKFADTLKQRSDTLREAEVRVIALRKDREHARNSRRAAFNLMEDAVLSRQMTEKLNLELYASKERYRTLFDLGPIAVCSCDASGMIETFNRRAAELWGREPDWDHTQQHYSGYFKMFQPDGRLMANADHPMAKILRGQIPEVRDQEVLMERTDGTRIATIVNIRPLHDLAGVITGAINCFYDITSRKQAQDALRESEEFKRSIIESSPDCIKVLDLDGKLLSMQSGQALLGIDDLRPFLNRDWVDFWAGDDRQAAQLAVTTAGQGGTSNFVGFFRTLRGEPKWWDVAVSPILDSHKNPTRLLAVSRDVTQRKEAADALRDSESRYRELFNSIDEGFCVIEMIFDANDQPIDYQFLEVNPAFERQTGLQSAAGHRMLELAPLHEKKWFEIYGQVSRTGVPIRFVDEAKALDRWFDVYAFKLGGRDSRKVAIIFNNITYRKQTERNREFLESLSQDLSRFTKVDEMMVTLGAKMAAFFELSLCAFVEINEAADEVVIAHNWHRSDVPSLVGTHRLADFVEGEFIPLARAGQVIVVRDTADDARTDARKFAALQIGAFICVPLIRDGHWRFALCLYHSSAYDWPTDEIELARELIERIWTRLERLRTEAALRESEERYRSLFTSIDEGFCTAEVLFDATGKTRDYRILEANPAFAKHTGIKQPVGQRVSELLPGLEQAWFDIYEQVVSTGESVRVERASAVQQRWYDVFVSRIGDATSRKVAIVLTDITQRILAQKNLAEKVRLLDLSNDAIVLLDLDGQIKSWNRGAEKLFVWTSEEAIGQPLHLLLKTEFPIPREEIVAQLYREPDFTDEVVQTTRDGRQIPSLCRWVLDLDTKSILTSYTDITDRKAAEVQMAAARDVAERANISKDMFLAALSHELRTPLGPVLLLAGEAADDPEMPPAARETFSTIVKNVKLEARLIDDLLDVTRITHGKLSLDLRIIDVHAVLRDAIETVRSEMDYKHLHLTLDLAAENSIMLGDPVRLQQIFWNVLRNAAKFSPADQEIVVRTTVLNDDILSIVISDHGIGMTKEELGRLFASFAQGDHASGGGSHRFGGLGLGLSISRMLAEMHSGTIRAESPGVQHGATFYIELPLDSKVRMQAPARLTPPRGRSGASADAKIGPGLHRILLVEDHVATRTALEHLLRRRNYVVVPVGSLAEARAAAESTTFDLIISDLGLPDGSGLDLMAGLHTRFGLKGIALTGYGRDDDFARTQQAGFVAHLVKPVSIQSLETALAGIRESK
jgi:PAS domain S-box-containing protein